MRISDWSSDVCSSDLTNVMPVAIIVMVRDVLVRIRWHLIDVAIGMDCELDARDASPRQIGGMSHAGEAGEDQHQACQERQKGSHEPALTTERFPCHCNNSRAGAFAARHAGQASPSTRHAERRKITAINPPTMMSGQAEPVRPTNPAAARTPTFDATSLREHSNVLDMFTFSRRKRQSSARQIRFATSAALPTPSIKPDAGGTPFAILSAISKMTATPKARMMPPFASAAPASQRAPRCNA